MIILSDRIAIRESIRANENTENLTVKTCGKYLGSLKITKILIVHYLFVETR